MKKFSKLVKSAVVLCTAFLVIGHAGAASAAELSQDQKDAYYKQYVEIVKEVVSEHPGVSLEVAPAEEFQPEDWVDPAIFKKIAEERASAKFVVTDNKGFSVMSTASASKTATLNSNGASVTLTINGSFETSLAGGRQVFSGINSITSSTNKGSWTQTGYEYDLYDASRTYGITVGGKVTLNGLTSSHNVFVEFYCGATGVVS